MIDLIADQSFHDPQNREGVFVHAQVGMCSLLGVDPASEVFVFLQALGGGDLAVLEPADDLQHPFREPAILGRVLVHQFAGHAFQFGRFADERLLEVLVGLPIGVEIVGEVGIGDRAEPDGRGQARRMDVLFQHVPDLTRVGAVIDTLVLVDHLGGDLEESGCPFDLGSEVQDRGIGRQFAVDLDEGPGQPLEFEPVVLQTTRDNIANPIGCGLLVEAHQLHVPLLTHVAGVSLAQISP